MKKKRRKSSIKKHKKIDMIKKNLRDYNTNIMFYTTHSDFRLSYKYSMQTTYVMKSYYY